MKLELAAVIPERELWFHNNPEARATVLGAIDRLKAGEMTDSPPDIDNDEAWIEELED
jgi:hypothetical protein